MNMCFVGATLYQSATILLKRSDAESFACRQSDKEADGVSCTRRTKLIEARRLGINCTRTSWAPWLQCWEPHEVFVKVRVLVGGTS